MRAFPHPSRCNVTLTSWHLNLLLREILMMKHQPNSLACLCSWDSTLVVIDYPLFSTWSPYLDDASEPHRYLKIIHKNIFGIAVISEACTWKGPWGHTLVSKSRRTFLLPALPAVFDRHLSHRKASVKLCRWMCLYKCFLCVICVWTGLSERVMT